MSRVNKLVCVLLVIKRYAIPGVLLLSVVITAVLLFYPRQSPNEVIDAVQQVSSLREKIPLFIQCREVPLFT